MIGKMRHRVAIQQRTNTRDAIGGVTQAWGTLATVWGDMVPLTGREGKARDPLQQQVFADSTHMVTIRYYQGLTVQHRLVINGEITLNIESVINPDGRKFFHEVMGKEEV